MAFYTFRTATEEHTVGARSFHEAVSVLPEEIRQAKVCTVIRHPDPAELPEAEWCPVAPEYNLLSSNPAI